MSESLQFTDYTTDCNLDIKQMKFDNAIVKHKDDFFCNFITSLDILFHKCSNVITILTDADICKRN